MKKLSLLAILFLSLILTACSSGKNDTLVVGSKDFTESIIVGELYTQALEAEGYKVKHQSSLGGSNILLEALKSKDLDIISEYTSTGLNTILKQDQEFDPDKAYEKVKEGYLSKFDLTWLNMSHLNNTQCIAVRKDVSDDLDFTKLSELADKSKSIRFASTPEFEEREDGLPGLEKILGDIKFEDIRVYDNGIKYQVLRNNEADMNVCFSTDADLASGDIVMIEDDLHFWPPYHLAPVVRTEVIEEDKKIAEVLNEVSKHLTTESIQVLNARVDVEEVDASIVAKEALIEWGLLK